MINISKIVFYGTSGWFEHEMGCTSCTGVFINDQDIVLFDLGTGIRKIDRDSVQGKNVTVLLSHLHLDHCYGLHILPMFQPAALTIVIHEHLKSYLNTLFSFPFMKPSNELGFPIHIQTVENTIIDHTKFTIKTKALNHNTPVIGAQLHLESTSIGYCVDSSLCDSLLNITTDCEFLIIEASPIAGRKTNGYHLTLEGLKKVLTTTHAKKVVITHFGALKYPGIKAKTLLFQAIEQYHNDIVMAYDGLIIRI